jgi:hypothetical protein
MLNRVWRVSPGTFSLLSGAMIAVSINFYTGIYSADELPSRWPLLMLAAMASFVSSASWAVISWNLDFIQRLAISEAPSWIDRTTADSAWLGLLQPRERLLRWAFILALFSAFVGLGVLPIGSAFTAPKVPVTRQEELKKAEGKTEAGERKSDLSKPKKEPK